ncbi:MAG: hypothetical protein JWP91_420, partial [Fibrobacteres bacterium]|nr:hypothetical protein [Fibrobacterota bacterium]
MASETLIDDLWTARRATESLCAPLRIEDHVVQPEACVSPPKWHLAHTAWFFETFLLGKHQPGYVPRDAAYAFLFNSYYESVGRRAEKARRGDYSRPSVEEIYAYRHAVDEDLGNMLASPAGRHPQVEGLVELGLHHEMQHQELLATDIKRILHFNPSRPAYRMEAWGPDPVPEGGPGWIGFPAGLREIGWSAEAPEAGGGFSFDNEIPRHQVHLRGFRIQDRLASNARYLEFMRDGGYSRPELWLSEGWRLVKEEGWRAPMYWEEDGTGWSEY